MRKFPVNYAKEYLLKEKSEKQIGVNKIKQNKHLVTTKSNND